MVCLGQRSAAGLADQPDSPAEQALILGSEPPALQIVSNGPLWQILAIQLLDGQAYGIAGP